METRVPRRAFVHGAGRGSPTPKGQVDPQRHRPSNKRKRYISPRSAGSGSRTGSIRHSRADQAVWIGGKGGLAGERHAYIRHPRSNRMPMRCRIDLCGTVEFVYFDPAAPTNRSRRVRFLPNAPGSRPSSVTEGVTIHFPRLLAQLIRSCQCVRNLRPARASIVGAAGERTPQRAEARRI